MRPLDDAQYGRALVAGQAGVEKRLEPIERQVQAVQQQINRFVPGVVGAVSEEQSAFAEAADGKAQEVAHGAQFVLRLFKHGWAARLREYGGRWLRVVAGRRFRRLR
jgi:photosystem II stability/assembly factor-like uncharacterized protein